jgi:hypothetical protein
LSGTIIVSSASLVALASTKPVLVLALNVSVGSVNFDELVLAFYRADIWAVSYCSVNYIASMAFRQ